MPPERKCVGCGKKYYATKHVCHMCSACCPICYADTYKHESINQPVKQKENMRKKVTLGNGVTLTREQIAEANRLLALPAKTVISVKGCMTIEIPTDHSHNQTLYLENRTGNSNYANKGVFLQGLPSDMRWAIVRDNQGVEVLTVLEKE